MDDCFLSSIGYSAEFNALDSFLVSTYFKTKSFRKKDFVFEHDDRVSDLFFIRSGLVRLSYWTEDGHEHILSFAMEGWWETDFSAFYQELPARFTLYCMEDTEMYSLSLARYRQLCQNYPHFAAYFLDKSVRGHIASQQRLLSLLSQTSADKYQQFLATYPALIARISKTVLASYLGVSRETLSRLHTKYK